MASVLVIGIGSTGLAVMERAQQFYYELTKQNTPGSHAAFMFLETDSNRQPELTPNGSTEIRSCYLCSDHINATLSNWNKENKWKWLPSTAQVLNTHSGAGGQPVYGRVALWANETLVSNLVTELYAKIQGNAFTSIYIVGSLTGGTGTGIFIDLAYLVRQCTQNSNIYGMFMLPNRQNVGQSTLDTIYENAYSSLKTLDVFSKADTQKNKNYECILPGGTDISSLYAPFKNIQFYTQDFSEASASLVGVPQLVQSVGFNLMLRVLDVTNTEAPFQDLVNARVVDYNATVVDGINTTMGMNVFQYPEALLEEYLTTKLLEEKLLNRWSDIQNYLDKNGSPQTIDSHDATLRIAARNFVQNTLEAAIQKCKGSPMLGASTYYLAMNSEISKILSGNTTPSLDNFIYSLFDANSQAPKFYAAISGQATQIRDIVIEEIAKKIGDASSEYQNLRIIELWLRYICQSLEDVVADWDRRFKIDGTANMWNNAWKKICSERLSKGKAIYAMTGCKKEWYVEGFDGVATLCYFNALIPMIKNITDSMLNRNGQGAIMTASNIYLPTMNEFTSMQSKVAKLLDAQDNLSIVARKESLRGQMNNNKNSQFIFLFNNGQTCDEDIRVAEGKYNSQSTRLSFENISNDTLWSFFIKNDITAIKAKMISGGLARVQDLKLFANTDIVQVMKNLPAEHPVSPKVKTLLTKSEIDIVKEVPAMARLINSEQFMPHNCLKLIIASPVADNNANGIVSAMNFKPSPNASNYVQLPSLKNTIVVYQEYGYLGVLNNVHKVFNPLVHLSYQEQVFESICAKIKNGAYDPALRLAYIDKETLLDKNNVKIK